LSDMIFFPSPTLNRLESGQPFTERQPQRLLCPVDLRRP
jgi:hypothetical protein